MNLTTTSSFIRKYWWIPLIIILILILVSLIYFRFTSKPTKNLPTLEAVRVLDLPVNIRAYTANELKPPSDTPKSLAVYTASLEFGFSDKVDAIMSEFNIKGEKKQANDTHYGQGIFVSDTNGILLIYNDFINYQTLKISTDPNIQFDEYKLGQAAKEHLTSLNLLPNDTNTYWVAYSHFKGEEFYEDSNTENASLINFYFPQKVMDYELLSPGKTTSVEFNKRNQITKTTISATKKLNTLDKYQIISYKDALNILENGGGFIVSIYGEGTNIVTNAQNRNLEKANLTRAYIAYYDSPTGKITQPVWVFEGESLVNKIPVIMKIIVPAIPQVIFTGTTQP